MKKLDLQIIKEFKEFAKFYNKKIFITENNIRIDFNKNQNLGFDFYNNDLFAYTWIDRKKKQKNKTLFLEKRFIQFCRINNIHVEHF